ncbi:MAG: hypothetical protein FJZ01_04425 [Candidatus Sericytochromatia bacterium]|nr:hypothetical protein [Candidatus Tanganyikabacteria bacterium]
MLNVFGGLEKLAGAIGKVANSRPTAEAADVADAAPAGGSSLGRDTAATCCQGMTSAIGLEPAVTLEGIASTLSRIYSAA